MTRLNRQFWSSLCLLLLMAAMTSGFAAEDAKTVTPSVEKKQDTPTAKVSQPKAGEDTSETALEEDGIVHILTPELLEQKKQLSKGSLEELKHLHETLQLQHQTIANELADDTEVSVTDMAMLWEAAVEQSGTIRYAIEKLSRRDQTGKPVEQDGFTKRMISSLARLGGVASSMVSGNPMGMVGSSMVDEMLAADPMSAGRNVTISDADMLILAKEVDTLQTQLLHDYFSYRHAYDRWKQQQDATLTMNRHADKLKHSSGDEHEAFASLMDTLVDNLKQEEDAAYRQYVSSRNALGLLVGQEALLVLDNTFQDQPQ